jgi:hypothetical protein
LNIQLERSLKIKMTNKIFWVEDDPGFLPLMGLLVPSLNLSDLLSRTTFAHDLETAKQAAIADPFDLYILDGDFPTQMAPERIAQITDFLQKVKEKTWGVNGLPFYDDKKHPIRNSSNNFVNLYRESLSHHYKVVIHSGSLEVALNSFNLGLPFYSKLISPERVVNYVKSLSDQPIPENMLSSWEIGTSKEFFEKYLVK